jgi:cytoskeleton protein RodZ
MTESNHLETAGASSASASVPAESVSKATAGQLIRAQRIKLGVHLAVLSMQLKLPQKQLEALEADQHDLAKGPAFVRALASSVCRQLRMDPLPVLALLPQASIQLPVQRHAMGALHSERPKPSDLGGGMRSIPPQTLAIAALMIGLIAALLWMPSPSTWEWLLAKPQPAAAVSLMPSQSDSLPPSQPLQIEATEPVPASQTSSAAVSVLTAPAVVPAPAQDRQSKALTEPSFVFSAHADSWIEIRDGKDRVLWSRLLRAGEKNEIQYPLPIRVVVGRSNAVTVTYRGQPFDLAPHTKVSVARFEVKE